MTGITVDELKRMSRLILRRSISKLIKAKGVFDAEAYIIHADKSVERAVFDGEIMNHGDAKEALFWALAQRAREVGGHGLIIASDTWTLEYTEEQQRRLTEDSDYREAYLRATAKSVPDAAAAGFGTLREAIACSTQTRLFAGMLIQKYERLGADKSYIRIMGDVSEMDSTEHESVGSLGRMFQLYDEGGTGHA